MQKLLSWGLPLLSLLRLALPVHAVPTDAQIEAILKQRIDREKQSPGIVVGIIDPPKHRSAAHGRTAIGSAWSKIDRPPLLTNLADERHLKSTACEY